MFENKWILWVFCDFMWILGFCEFMWIYVNLIEKIQF